MPWQPLARLKIAARILHAGLELRFHAGLDFDLRNFGEMARSNSVML
jgi:hypothetical protein